MNVKRATAFKFTALFLLICLQSICADHAMAQSDTVQARLRFDYLNDSTLVRYEIGSVGLTQADSLRFLHFPCPQSSYSTSFFRTEIFTSTGADTILFDRFASFDDNRGRMSYDGRVPDVGTFDANSSILYVLELIDAESSELIARLDTLKCFLNAEGVMKYQNFPCSYSLRTKVPLTGAISNHSYYLKVETISNLASNGSYVWSEYFPIDHNLPRNRNNWISTWADEVGYPPFPSPKTTSKNSTPAIQSPITNLLISPNPSSGDYTLSFSLSNAQNIRVILTNEFGNAVIDRESTYESGTNKLRLSISKLPSGSYFLRLISPEGVVSSNLKLIH